MWGPVLVEISRKNNGGGLGGAFLRVFEENCWVALEERIEFMKPDVDVDDVIVMMYIVYVHGVCGDHVGYPYKGK